MTKPLTVTLVNGVTVLAKLYDGEPYAMTYANRTQAERACQKLGPDWYVWHGMARPFFVVKREDPT